MLLTILEGTDVDPRTPVSPLTRHPAHPMLSAMASLRVCNPPSSRLPHSLAMGSVLCLEALSLNIYVTSFPCSRFLPRCHLFTEGQDGLRQPASLSPHSTCLSRMRRTLVPGPPTDRRAPESREHVSPARRCVPSPSGT